MNKTSGSADICSACPRPLAWWLAFLLSLLFFPRPGLALEAVEVAPDVDTIALGPHLEYLRDPARNLSLPEVRRRSGDFEKNPDEVKNAGYTADGFWIRFRLANSSDQRVSRFLEFRSRFADRLDLYVPGRDDAYTVMNSGRFVLPPARPHPARDFVFPLELPPDSQQTWYLYVDSADTLTIPLYLHSAEGLKRVELTGHTWLVFYQGVILAMAVFSLFLLITLKDRLYLYYICALVLHQGFVFILFDGLGYQYFGLEDPWWTREGIAVATCVSMWLIMQFSRLLLQTRQQQPRMDRLVVWLQNAALVVAVLSAFLDYYIGIRLTNPIASSTAALLWVVGWNALIKGNPAARYYLSAWTLLIFGGIAYSLKAWGLLPSNVFTEYGWQMGAAIEAILLSMAIAERISIETRQRIESQQEAQRAQARALEIQQKANETLEERVRQRTKELEEANRKLQMLSDTDQLTGLANRRVLERHLAQVFGRASAGNESVAVLMIDVDHFKSINDNHGHAAGDRCLEAIADRILASTRRPGDLVARFGGEEFCVVIFPAATEVAWQTAERIRQAIEAQPVDALSLPLQLTVSIGLYAAVPQPGDDGADFLKLADEALYRSKEEGRNRVTLYRELESETAAGE